MTPPISRRIAIYLILSAWNTAVVYALYSVYVVLWLRFDFDQYLRWLIGGIPMSMLTGWLIVKANVWFARKLDRKEA